MSRRFVSPKRKRKDVETGWKTREGSGKIIVVSTLLRLMLKVHSVVVVTLQYPALLVCIDENDSLY